MDMKKEISLKSVQESAEVLYRKGYSCSESLVAAIRDCFDLSISKDVIALATGFSGGIGRSGCVCGAVAGGVMSLGMFFGRNELGDSMVEINHRCSKELHDYFKEATGKKMVCCRILTRGLDLGKGEHKKQCTQFVGLVAYKVAEIIVRECHLINIDLELNDGNT